MTEPGPPAVWPPRDHRPLKTANPPFVPHENDIEPQITAEKTHHTSKRLTYHKVMLPNQLEELGHALSKVVQYRYSWLVSHVTRGAFLHLLDNRIMPPLPPGYSFSLEDERNDVPPIPIAEIILPQVAQAGPLSESTDGTKFDHTYIRDLTRTALRASVLESVQSCLEYHKIADLIAAEKPEHSEMFFFLRLTRNIILHAHGVMKKRDLKRTVWRGVVIENNGQQLKLSDIRVHALLEDIIEVLARLYVANGKRLDYVTANLGYGVPFIRECADNMWAEDAVSSPQSGRLRYRATVFLKLWRLVQCWASRIARKAP